MASRSVGRIQWPILGVAVLLQLVLFSRWAQREIVWGYPTNNDQAQYLLQAYGTYEAVRSRGLLRGLWEGLTLPVAQGALIHVEAAGLFFVLGASRFNALLLNLLHLAAFECALVGVVSRLSRGWEAPVAALGLVMTVGTTFFFAGGIGDFRLDFIGWTLFGLFICAVARSGVFRSVRWSVVAGLVAAVLGLFRFIAALYLTGIMVVTIVALLLMQWRRGDPELRMRLRGAAVAASVLWATTLPVLASRWPAVMSYYLVGHVTGSESAIRARELGVQAWRDGLLFYPMSVLRDHAGAAFLVAAAAVYLASSVRGSPGRTAPGLVGALYAFVAVCIVVPLGVLMVNPTKSPVVGAFIIPALIWLAILPMMAATGGVDAHDRRRQLIRGAACLTLALGTSFQVTFFTWKRVHSAHRADVLGVLEMSDLMAGVSRQRGWTSPLVSADHVSDYLPALGATTYERQGWMLVPRFTALGGGIFAITRDEALRELRRSDFVVLTTDDAPPSSSFPLDDTVRGMRSELHDACRAEFSALRTFAVRGRNLVLYVRRPDGYRP